MSTSCIVCDIKMNTRVIFVCCCTLIIQEAFAAPAVSLEVDSSVANGGEAANPLIQNATGGDLLLKTPEPLHPGAATATAAAMGAGAASVAASVNDLADQAQLGEHVLPAIDLSANGNISASPPTSLLAASSSGWPGEPTLETTNSPLDSELQAAAATGLPLPAVDPMLFYKILTSMIRHPEQVMQSLFPPFSPIFPTMRMPNFRAQMPSINLVPNDPSLKLVDQKIIDDGTVKGQFNSYEGRPDPNTVSKMQTGQFSLNKDGVQGTGMGRIYSSSTASSSSGGSPLVSVGTYLGGLPSQFPRFNMAFPLRLT